MIPYTKAHACGNDFLIVTEEAAKGRDWAALTRALCERNTGVGADGVEFFAWTGKNSGRIVLHNADGSIAEISGNGTRCVAAWMAREVNAQAGSELAIETEAGLRICRVNAVDESNGYTVQISAGMGVPKFAERVITLSDGTKIAGVEVNTGNPHFDIVVDNDDFLVQGRPWQRIGKEICFHPGFPHQTNVEFIRKVNAEQIEIRIFERGVGPTTSSGTGTSAASTVAIALNGCTSPLTIVAPGGAQTIAWSGPSSELVLTGPATLITRGEAWA